MAIIEINGIAITIPDEGRGSIYHTDLKIVAQSIEQSFEMPNFQSGSSAFFKSKTSNRLSSGVFKSIMNNVVPQYDALAMEYVQLDLKKYLRDRVLGMFGRISEAIISKLLNEPGLKTYISKSIEFRFKGQPKEIIQKKITDSLTIKSELDIQYAEYFTSMHSEKNYTQVLFQKYPELKSRLTKITANYVKAIKKLLRRLNNDMEMLKKHFLYSLDNPVLSRIISSGSDFHKQGQQVLILVFDGVSEGSIKVIYKPSPITADAMLFGDLSKLQTINSKFSGQSSFVELLNKALIEDCPDNQPLTTYLIVPCLDKESSSLDSHYGYTEFLTHSPVERIDREKMADSILKKYIVTPSVLKKIQEKINDDIRQEELAFLRQAAFEVNSDFVTHSWLDVERYSHDCGLLLGLMTATGISDSHLENIIIHLLRPALIDGEVCFCVQVSPTPEDSSALHLQNGSMNAVSTAIEVFSFMHDITGMHEINITVSGKNRLYYVNEIGEMAAQQPKTEIVVAAYKKFWELMQGLAKDSFLAWYEQEQVREMFVRVIPQSTSLFQGEMKATQAHQFTYSRYEEYCIKKMSKGIYDYHDAIEKFNFRLNLGDTDNQDVSSMSLRSEKEPYEYITDALPPSPVPNAAIFSNDSRTLNIYSEYKNNSIPVYYMQAGDTKLTDFNGNYLCIPDGFIKLRNQIGRYEMESVDQMFGDNNADYRVKTVDEEGYTTKEHLKSLPAIEGATDNEFLVEPPLKTTQERFKKILSNKPLQEQLIKVVKSQTARLAPSEVIQSQQKSLSL